MIIRCMADGVPARALAGICVIALSAVLLNPAGATATGDMSISTRFEEVVSLRGHGEYSRAIEMLREIISECGHAREITCHAYNYLVTIIWDETGSKDAAANVAREAVGRFPDIKSDPNTFPPPLNLLYEELRAGLADAEPVPRAPGLPGEPSSVLEHPNVSSRFAEAVSSWEKGEYAAAMSTLRGIIDEYSRADEISRRAYNYLVITVWDMDERETAIEAAQEALLLYPDLEVDTLVFPPKLNTLYSEVRSLIFGALYVEAETESCRVFLDDEYLGKTPLDIPFVPIGEHIMVLKKEGYHDYSKVLDVRPGTATRMEDLRLSRVRDWRWWFWRVGPPVAALVTVGVLSSGQGERGAQELRDPPPPPGH
jgi:tetratricopeptide (TPR) repeat protein